MISVSIIIPIYKVEDYILDCLQSVANQTYSGPIECICVDDCSPDNSAKIAANFIDSYCGPIDFKLIHHSNNKGVSATRNTGTVAATGDYVCFLDGDDELTDDCIKMLARSIEKHEYSFVVSDFEIIPDNVKKIYEQKLDDGKVFYGGVLLTVFQEVCGFRCQSIDCII